MSPHSTYFRAITVGAFAATVVLILGADGWIDADTFTLFYEPFAWCCYKLPWFVIEHEAWIEVFAAFRLLLRLFWR